jgi:hypothetical protein
MLQALQPADAPRRRPAPVTFRSIAVTTTLALAVGSAVAVGYGVLPV